MTWSIIARDKATGAFGIAVATKFFAVGARVPFIAAGVGAVATQALINPFYGSKGLQLLHAGMTADAIVKALVADDPGRDHRQMHVMDASGLSAAHTGAACIDWNGHLAGDTFSIAGNMLAGAKVLDATVAAYVAGESMPFARRLIAAMRAGEAAGGDKRRVIADANARYFGAILDDRTLTPGDHPRFGPTSFDQWLNQATPAH